ncbi:hypothetical protein [Compostibacter hankyongensis]|uniref:Uncharacterized protein n=1 Tax=Compostibacter hankyongensis TaxID=1007089 RepID=A0ABP8FG73_9BACT
MYGKRRYCGPIGEDPPAGGGEEGLGFIGLLPGVEGLAPGLGVDVGGMGEVLDGGRLFILLSAGGMDCIVLSALPLPLLLRVELHAARKAAATRIVIPGLKIFFMGVLF